MINIKLPAQYPEEINDWITEAKELTEELLEKNSLAEKHTFIEANKSFWRKPELVSWLSELSHHKCWYTETYFGGDYQEVEHFRPKKALMHLQGTNHPSHSGYYWLSFDIKNYRLCKSRPNRKKGNYFPLLNEAQRISNCHHSCQIEMPTFLDPLDREDPLLLSFNEDGVPECADDISDDQKVRVQTTIDKFFLDEQVLNDRRRTTWLAVRALYNDYISKSLKFTKCEQDDPNKPLLEQEAKSAFNQLLEMFKPEKEFSSVARESLLKTGESRANRILMTALSS